MFHDLPGNALEFIEWPWSRIEGYFQELEAFPLEEANCARWLGGWTQLSRLFNEAFWRLNVAVTVDTTDRAAEARYQRFLDEIRPQGETAMQRLKEKLLGSGLSPEGFEVPLQNMQAEAEIFSLENLPRLSEELKATNEYGRIIGAQTVAWEGREWTLMQLMPEMMSPDRGRREQVWRLAMERQLADWQALGELWTRLLDLRQRIATGAGLPDYRAYQWKVLHRFDYTPDDCRQFHQAIEQVIVPAVRTLNERRQSRLEVDCLRPWDLEVDPYRRPALKPFERVEQLSAGAAAIFHQVDPQLGAYFDTMLAEGLLDLENRKGKAPGGYCCDFPVVRRPFIFMNAVGIHDDVVTLLHEGGHAFHVFETAHLPYDAQVSPGLEFAEVASMAMELLAAPYLGRTQGGFYTPAETARALSWHLETHLRFWPYMAVVDAFQHWAYENPQLANRPENCDAAWSDLWDRYMVGVDWSGLDAYKATGWQRKQHIFETPFYYVEYGLAQLGATLVWRNALTDQAGAVAAYRRALALGGTRPLPDLFAAAGVRFAFDEATLGQAVDLMMQTLDRLDSQQAAG